MPASREPLTRERATSLGDFTLTPRVGLITMLAFGIGALASVVALALLRLIGLCTNLFFYQRVDTRLVAPGTATTTLSSSSWRRSSAGL